jgi:predicted secreted Zn-dependent protease
LAVITLRAAAEPVISESTSYYDISGSTPAQLVAQMGELGPTDEKGDRRFWAYTKWFVNWRFTSRRSATGCLIDTVSVSLEINYTYPRWRNEEAANEPVRNAWSQMMAALERHERQHGQHGLDAAHEVERAIAGIPGRETCRSLVEDTNALAYSIAEKHAARDREFDRRTEHGRAEGVRLP